MGARNHLVILVVSAILAGFILRFSFSGERNFENAALGTLTVSYEAKDELGRIIHTTQQRETEIEDMLNVAKSSNRKVLVLGNSQTHSINQKIEGEVVYPELLHALESSTAVLTNSLPNANLQEFYVILSWWLQQANFDQVIVPIFMDDLREDGLRKDFLNALGRNNFQLKNLDAFNAELNAQLRELQPSASSQAEEDGTDDETPQDYVERELNVWLNEHSETWSNRPNARGDFFLALYRWRNQLFNISATTTRKMIPARKEKNMKALKRILDLTASEEIPTLIYIPPIRTDVEVPYDLKEYEAFKAEVKDAVAAHVHTDFKNWEGIVPGELWGLKASTSGDDEPELDFMHFQYRGHQIVADSLAQFVAR